MAETEDWRGRAHVELIMDLSPEDWQRWRHNAITAAFLQFLRDRLELCRHNAAALVEMGWYDVAAQAPDRNPNVMRGQILTLDELQQISVEAIQGFYREEREAKEST